MKEKYIKCKKCKCKEPILTAIHDINTFACTEDNELYLGGKNEHGEDITIVFNAIEVLEWVGTEIPYIKEQTIKYINNLD